MIETVNGYVCHNCSDVALAKRNIDPAHPKDGPNGVDAPKETNRNRGDDAVQVGGALAPPTTVPRGVSSTVSGGQLDIRV